MQKIQSILRNVDTGENLCRQHSTQEEWDVADKYGHLQSVRVLITVGICDKCADEVTPEEAWQFVALFAGMLAGRSIYWNDEKERAFRREAYVILGKARVRITPEVKERVRGILDDARIVDGPEYADIRDKVLGL